MTAVVHHFPNTDRDVREAASHEIHDVTCVDCLRDYLDVPTATDTDVINIVFVRCLVGPGNDGKYHLRYVRAVQRTLWASFCAQWVLLGVAASPLADHYLTGSQRREESGCRDETAVTMADNT